MKNFAFVLCIMFLFMGTASAYISKEADKFDGTITIESVEDFGKTKYILEKKFYKDQNEPDKMHLSIFKSDYTWWFFSKNSFEFKIDDKIYETNEAITISQMSGNLLITGGMVVIDNNLVDKILNSKSITIRYHFNNKQSEIWTVPGNVLEEWKEVLLANKDWSKKKKK